MNDKDSVVFLSNSKEEYDITFGLLKTKGYDFSNAYLNKKGFTKNELEGLGADINSKELHYSSNSFYKRESGFVCYEFGTEEWFQAMSKLEPINRAPQLSISGYKVGFKEGGIMVGCANVSNDTIKKIYDHQFKDK